MNFNPTESEGTAAFIARMLTNLADVAAPHPDLALLHYLLETARSEAEARAAPQTR